MSSDLALTYIHLPTSPSPTCRFCRSRGTLQHSPFSRIQIGAEASVYFRLHVATVVKSSVGNCKAWSPAPGEMSRISGRFRSVVWHVCSLVSTGFNFSCVRMTYGCHLAWTSTCNGVITPDETLPWRKAFRSLFQAPAWSLSIKCRSSNLAICELLIDRLNYCAAQFYLFQTTGISPFRSSKSCWSIHVQNGSSLPVLEPQAADLPLLFVLLQTAHGGGQAKGQANTAGRSASLQHLVLAVNQWKNIGKACHGLCP